MRRSNVLALIAGLVVGSMVTMAAGVGAATGDPMLLGTKNVEKRTTKLVTRGGLWVSDVKPGNPALILTVADGGTPPLQVNSSARVALLNADLVDGMEASAFQPAGQPFHTPSCANCTGLEVNAFGAYLPGLDLTDASLTGAVFAAADLTGAHLSTGMPGANFSRAILTNADLSNSWVSSGVFWMASLDGADLTSAALDAAYFWGADLTGATLIDANLAGAFLQHADLTGGDLTGATLTSVTWLNTTCPDGTNTDTNGDGDCDGAHRTP